MSKKSEVPFSETIFDILSTQFGKETAKKIFSDSPLIGYLVIKTKAANKGSKSRGSFANLYAIYVLVEDYIAHKYHMGGDYKKYEGARFSTLFARQRELPFGNKLQNHALNSRLNEEFYKYYPQANTRPIIRDDQRYWFSEQLLISHNENIATSVIRIIDSYIDARRGSFNRFLEDCHRIQKLDESKVEEKRNFIESLLSPATDARLFEIVSFAIMKSHYGTQAVWIGWEETSVEEEPLILYKTGRTNANDGGIDFVMRPLGRFFQVTESLDLKKYFLDIDKLQRFPITFVIKTQMDEVTIRRRLKEAAEATFGIESIVNKYLEAVEEIINIPRLLELFDKSMHAGYLAEIIDELVIQSRAEFHLSDDEEEMLKSINPSNEVKQSLDI